MHLELVKLYSIKLIIIKLLSNLKFDDFSFYHDKK